CWPQPWPARSSARPSAETRRREEAAPRLCLWVLVVGAEPRFVTRSTPVPEGRSKHGPKSQDRRTHPGCREPGFVLASPPAAPTNSGEVSPVRFPPLPKYSPYGTGGGAAHQPDPARPPARVPDGPGGLGRVRPALRPEGLRLVPPLAPAGGRRP